MVLALFAGLGTFMGLIASTRAESRGLLTSDEMNRSRGGDLGKSVVTIHCDGVGGNKKRSLACPQGAEGFAARGEFCTTCDGGKVKGLGDKAGRFINGEGLVACGHSRTGTCQPARHSKSGRTIKSFECKYETVGKKGPGCVPGPSRPTPQTTVIVGPGPGSSPSGL